jgi:prevent-host-death family protein
MPNRFEITQEDLQAHLSETLRQVARGVRVRVTVNGKGMADLVPVDAGPRFASRADVLRLLEEAPLDSDFERSVDTVVGDTIEDL